MNSEDVLQSFVGRLERLQSEKDSLSADIREVFAEANDVGVDVKALREVLKERKRAGCLAASPALDCVRRNTLTNRS